MTAVCLKTVVSSEEVSRIRCLSMVSVVLRYIGRNSLGWNFSLQKVSSLHYSKTEIIFCVEIKTFFTIVIPYQINIDY